jgi:hypothetical protein
LPHTGPGIHSKFACFRLFSDINDQFQDWREEEGEAFFQNVRTNVLAASFRDADDQTGAERSESAVAGKKIVFFFFAKNIK